MKLFELVTVTAAVAAAQAEPIPNLAQHNKLHSARPQTWESGYGNIGWQPRPSIALSTSVENSTVPSNLAPKSTEVSPVIDFSSSEEVVTFQSSVFHTITSLIPRLSTSATLSDLVPASSSPWDIDLSSAPLITASVSISSSAPWKCFSAYRGYHCNGTPASISPLNSVPWRVFSTEVSPATTSKLFSEAPWPSSTPVGAPSLPEVWPETDTNWFPTWIRTSSPSSVAVFSNTPVITDSASSSTPPASNSWLILSYNESWSTPSRQALVSTRFLSTLAPESPSSIVEWSTTAGPIIPSGSANGSIPPYNWNYTTNSASGSAVPSGLVDISTSSEIWTSPLPSLSSTDFSPVAESSSAGAWSSLSSSCTNFSAADSLSSAETSAVIGSSYASSSKSLAWSYSIPYAISSSPIPSFIEASPVIPISPASSSSSSESWNYVSGPSFWSGPSSATQVSPVAASFSLGVSLSVPETFSTSCSTSNLLWSSSISSSQSSIPTNGESISVRSSTLAKTSWLGTLTSESSVPVESSKLSKELVHHSRSHGNHSGPHHSMPETSSSPSASPTEANAIIRSSTSRSTFTSSSGSSPSPSYSTSWYTVSSIASPSSIEASPVFPSSLPSSWLTLGSELISSPSPSSTEVGPIIQTTLSTVISTSTSWSPKYDMAWGAVIPSAAPIFPAKMSKSDGQAWNPEAHGAHTRTSGSPWGKMFGW